MLASAILVSALLADTKAEIAEARSVEKSAAAVAEKNIKTTNMFMSDADTGKKWSKMATAESHLDKEGMWNCDTTAFVYTSNGKIVYVAAMQSSSSGDWGQGINYSYRTDGSLAVISAGYSAFSPVEGSLVREWFYNKKGKLIGSTLVAKNSDQKPLAAKEKAEMTKYAPAAPKWMKVSQLPFLNLIKK